MREDNAVLGVALVEYRGALRCIPDVRHVLLRVETLVSGTVELAAQPAGIVVVGLRLT